MITFKPAPIWRMSLKTQTEVAQDGKGYIEDRRPNANADPYTVAALMTNKICGALAE